MVEEKEQPTASGKAAGSGLDFPAVLDAELRLIGEKRGSRSASDDITGLAFSGGGIRSATFNLGVLQALAELRLLRRFDYLSTVSGGGYIGSWLSAWMAHQNKRIEEIEEALAPNLGGRAVVAAGDDEPHALRHLRSYTNYLKPHGGFFSVDALTAATTWLRNTLLNQLILVAAFAALLLACLGAGTVAMFYWHAEASFMSRWPIWAAANVLLAVAIGVINANLLFTPTAPPERWPWYVRNAWVIAAGIIPLTAGSFLMSLTLPSLAPAAQAAGTPAGWGVGAGLQDWSSVLLFLGVPLGLCAIAFLAGLPWKAANGRDTHFYAYAFWFLVAALLALSVFLPFIAKLLVPPPFRTEASREVVVLANILSFGPPVILCGFSLAVFAYVGMIGRIFDEHQREWWSRFAAMVLFSALVWLLVFGCAVWGPLIVAWLRSGLTVAIAWLATSGLGALAGRSASTSGRADHSSKWREVIAQAAPYVFVPGLCLLVAYWVNESLLHLACPATTGPMDASCRAGLTNAHGDDYGMRLAQLQAIFQHPREIVICLLVTAAVAAVLVWRVDINLFSFHSFYRNRLTRAYLAAGIPDRTRRASVLPLTGMSDKDSPRLQDLPSRPYHLLNTALNITSSRHLSWQERKAASFCFGKQYSGYYLPGEEKAGTYCATSDFLSSVRKAKPGLPLSLPMTISGAAACPTSGYHTSGPVAFLMTVFNVRLGWWMQNTRNPADWKSGGPSIGLWYLLKELTANVDERSPFVYLSDGGHFDNLGVYELVRRRCAFILACDASEDCEFAFEDLGNTIRKCYIDLGVRIDIDVSPLRPASHGPARGRSAVQSCIGSIYYPAEGDRQGDVGLLLYVKSSLGASEATDIEQYKAAHPDYPHEPTLNQFFTESQFESYRKLGYTLCRRAIHKAKGAAAEAPVAPPAAMGSLERMLRDLDIPEAPWPSFSGALKPEARDR